MNKARITVVALAIGLAGCSPLTPSPEPRSADVAPSPPGIDGLPVKLAVEQRSTTELPGSDGQLSITAGDITRGQVMTSILRDGGDTLVGPVSMKEGDSQNFDFANVTYSLKLAELTNALVGEDFAYFVISESGQGTLSEEQKIQHLIATVEAMQGAIFVRNGTEYSAKAAADHLRQKRRAAGGEIDSATEFIDRIASKSSLTGEAYSIRLATGEMIGSGEFLRDELAKLQTGR